MISDQGLIVVDVAQAEKARRVFKAIAAILDREPPPETTIGDVQIFHIKADGERYTAAASEWAVGYQYINLPITARVTRGTNDVQEGENALARFRRAAGLSDE